MMLADNRWGRLSAPGWGIGDSAQSADRQHDAGRGSGRSGLPDRDQGSRRAAISGQPYGRRRGDIHPCGRWRCGLPLGFTPHALPHPTLISGETRAMAYMPSDKRYDTMLYRRTGRSGLKLPAISLGLWQNFGHTLAQRHGARDVPRRLRSGHHPFRSRQQLRPAAGLGRRAVRHHPQDRLPRSPRRDGHLDQGRLPHVARPLWRVGQPQISDLQPRPEPQAHGARLCRHLLFAPLRSRHAAGGDHGRAR